MTVPDQEPPRSADDVERAPVRCAAPTRLGPGWVRCGKCYLCRQYDGRVLAHRITLEARAHEEVAFVTLTYSPANLPADGCVSLAHMTQWLKRLRFRLQPRRVRYYYLAEYGEERLRPHYHVVLYGFPTCRSTTGETYFAKDGPERGIKPLCCKGCEILYETWGFGRAHSTPFNPVDGGKRGSQYLAMYAARRVETVDPLPHELTDEFARWSKRPGLGSGYVPEILQELKKFGELPADGPIGLIWPDGIVRPLGRYLRTKVREEIGSTSAKRAPAEQKRVARQREAARAAKGHGTTVEEMGAKLAAQKEREARKRYGVKDK